MPSATKSAKASGGQRHGPTKLEHMKKQLYRNRYLYLLLLPTLIWYIIFMYAPLYGAQIAFRDFFPATGITGAGTDRSTTCPWPPVMALARAAVPPVGLNTAEIQ